MTVTEILTLMKMKLDILKLKADDYTWACHTPQDVKDEIVVACDSDVIPNELRLANAADESELEEIFQTERHLLYVACTRARDFLIVSGVEPASEFIQDLLGEGKRTPTR